MSTARQHATVTIHALSAGFLTLPERFFITPASPTARRSVPSLCFLIQHTCSTTAKTTRIVFDLGLRREPSTYSAPIRNHCSNRQPMITEPDVIASLAEGGLSPDEIDWVVLSHVHYDHIGTPSDFGSSKTTFVVGPGSLDLLSGTAKLRNGSHSFFEPNLLPERRTVELPNPNGVSFVTVDKGSSSSTWRWKPLTLFPHTIDFFGDGSLHIIHAPGHLPGHINLLARLAPPLSSPTSLSSSTPSSRRRWIYLAGDACHDMRLFTGECEIATWTDDHGQDCCIHADLTVARETLARIQRLGAEGFDDENGDRNEGPGPVEVVFAHNWSWECVAREHGRFWPGQL